MFTLIWCFENYARLRANICFVLLLNCMLVRRLTCRRNVALARLNRRPSAWTLLVKSSSSFLRFIQFSEFWRVFCIIFDAFEIDINHRSFNLQFTVIDFVSRRLHQRLTSLVQLVSFLYHAWLARRMNLPWHTFITLKLVIYRLNGASRLMPALYSAIVSLIFTRTISRCSFFIFDFVQLLVLIFYLITISCRFEVHRVSLTLKLQRYH